MSKKKWKKVVGELSSAPKKGKTTQVHQKSKATREIPVPLLPRELSPDLPKTEDEQSEGEVEEELLLPSDDEALSVKMCRKGGTEAINFLLTKAVSLTALVTTQKSPKEWSY